MGWVGREAQLVNLLPRSNAHVGRVELRALLGQLLAPLLGTLRFILCEALGGSPDQIACGKPRHMSMNHEFQQHLGKQPGNQPQAYESEVQATRVSAAPRNFRP